MGDAVDLHFELWNFNTYDAETSTDYMQIYIENLCIKILSHVWSLYDALIGLQQCDICLSHTHMHTCTVATCTAKPSPSIRSV